MKKASNFNLPVSILDRLEVFSKRNEVSKSSVVRAALEMLFKERGFENK